MNTRDRKFAEEGVINLPDAAKQLGVKPARLFMALQPEREARRARLRQQPFGTPYCNARTPAIHLKLVGYIVCLSKCLSAMPEKKYHKSHLKR